MSQEPSSVSRRRVLQSAALGAAGLATASTSSARAADATPDEYRISNNRIRQSVVAWCFKPMSIADLAQHAKRMGYLSVELVPAAEWPK